MAHIAIEIDKIEKAEEKPPHYRNSFAFYHIYKTAPRVL